MCPRLSRLSHTSRRAADQAQRDLVALIEDYYQAKMSTDVALLLLIVDKDATARARVDRGRVEYS